MSDGQLISGRFQVGSLIGEGGMGAVYRAQDTLLKRDVAIKMLAPTGLGTEGRARLLHEAQAAAQLSHPNIVSVFDVGEENGSLYIIMELLEGESLHAQRPSELDQVVTLARQLCAALDHAHDHGVVHRDLKPENVMILEDGTAKLMDFGLARSAVQRLTKEGTVVGGTLHYMAPEMILGEDVDGRADLYALGVMLPHLGSQMVVLERRGHRTALGCATESVHIVVLGWRELFPGRVGRQIEALRSAVAFPIAAVRLHGLVNRIQQLGAVKRFLQISH